MPASPTTGHRGFISASTACCMLHRRATPFACARLIRCRPDGVQR